MAIPRLKVLELFSGVGGMHFALKEAGVPCEVIAAVDINTVTNDIYHHNFPNTRLINKGIETISLKEFNKLSPDVILMSPPCQPFVRVGKQRDVTDERTKSFLHLLNIITSLDKPVSYILLENVKGFDTSDAHRQLIDALLSALYNVQEFLLSPLQCGVPNSRLRYYLLAKKAPLKFVFPLKEEIWTDFPPGAANLLINILREEQTNYGDVNLRDNTKTDNEDKLPISADTSLSGSNNRASKSQKLVADTSLQNEETVIADSSSSDEGLCHDDKPLYEKCSSFCHPLSDYLENQPQEYFKDFMVPEKFFRRFWVMDIVKPAMKNSCCFTKRYGHHIEGAGSVIQTNLCSPVDLRVFKATREYSEEAHESVRDLQLRFFSPREIANLMHFPDSFSFPEGISTIQCYRVLGNSLNVHVVAVLLQMLMKDGL